MNVSDFIQLLHRPDTVDLEGSVSLEKVLDEYPYFQAARAVYLKGLKNLDSFKYNQALKCTAAYTADRTILFDFITSEDFKQNSIAKNISKQSVALEDIFVEAEEVPSFREMETREVFLGTKSEANAVLDPALFEKKEEEEEDELQLGKPLEFDENEKHSFSEWLKLSKLKPIDRGQEEEKKEESDTTDKKKEKFDLIDKFIASNPKIVPSKESGSSVNLAKQNMVERSELMTETLARVYLEQKKYKKAIQAYKILSLKYPEKSGFFADQIRAVKKLQQNN
ncbi:hypothetical protein GWK08_15280 [Leptobacterium flavescens]|uniref:Tetratricopeptide repeat protein n=1 Tax=Leptobacterium flavescens TaxID=472055 RepID=A0A6P0US55_9FLAO|nr:hypothetical protein [Leptobacterium flavescens]NER14818.1 hypothetical protein [Leptobacterium flavescens]